jgi:tetratricopeptide (TPR) repeat protein
MPVLLAKRLVRGVFSLALGVAAVTFGAGCAGHEDRLRTALDALDQGAEDAAIAALNEELEVSAAEDLPAELAGDNALLVLDRASILQSLDRYELSKRDFGAADKAIDVLDMSRGATDELGKYLLSDDVGPYRAPAYEKLLINTLNMANYLATGDLSGAKVEARRLAIMQKYIADQGDEGSLLGLGSLLAGLAFEKSGQKDEALLYYDEALRYAQYPSLRDPLRVLTQGAPRSPGITALVGDAGPLPPVSETGEAELVVMLAFGRVPPKIPVRLPIGLALTMVSGNMSPHDAAQANTLAAKGLVTWVNYPKLGRTRGRYAIPELVVDGQPEDLELALDVESEVRRTWEKNEGAVVLAAVTRTITRLVAGEAAAAATRAAAGKNGGALGLLVGLATTAAMTAADTPDTRSWATLPARIAIARRRIPPGEHVVMLGARGQAKAYRITVGPGGFAFVMGSVLR